ncbi:MAG: helix-turn-helix transcriptional regulator [Bacteriovoracaceae bacterium]
MSDTFAQKLKDSLEGHNLTKLANELDIPSSVLHDWCKGSRKPSMKNLKLVKRIADYTGLNFEELVLGDSYREEKTLTTVTFSDGGNRYSVSITKLKD